MYLQFAPNGQYGANDPVNYHLGYTLTCQRAGEQADFTPSAPN